VDAKNAGGWRGCDLRSRSLEMFRLLSILVLLLTVATSPAPNVFFYVTNNSACTIHATLLVNGAAAANSSATPGNLASTFGNYGSGTVTLVVQTNFAPLNGNYLAAFTRAIGTDAIQFFHNQTDCTPDTNHTYTACIQNASTTGRAVLGWWKINGATAHSVMIPFGSSACYTFHFSTGDSLTWGQEFFYPTIDTDTNGGFEIIFNNQGNSNLGGGGGGSPSNPVIGDGTVTNQATGGGGSPVTTPINSTLATNLINWNSQNTTAAREDTLKAGMGILSAKLDTVAENVLFSSSLLQTPLQEIATTTEQIGNEIVTVRTFMSNENIYAVATTNLLNSILTNMVSGATVSTSNLTVNVNVTNSLSLSNYLAISNSVSVTNIVQFPTNTLDDASLIERLKEFGASLFAGAGLITNATAAQDWASDNDGGMADAVEATKALLPEPMTEDRSGPVAVSIPLGAFTMEVDFLSSEHWAPVAIFAFNFFTWALFAVYATKIAVDLYLGAKAIHQVQQMRIPDLTAEVEALTFGAGGNLGALLYPVLLAAIGALIAVMGFYVAEALTGYAYVFSGLSTSFLSGGGAVGNGIALLKQVFPVAAAINLVVAYIFFRLGFAAASSLFGIAFRAIPG